MFMTLNEMNSEKGTPSETPRIEHLPSGLAMLCRPNGGCRPATKEELFFDSENSRLRGELEKKTAALSPDLYDDLCEFLRDQEEADLVDGRWKPNKAMSLLQQLEEEHAQSLRQPEREGWVSVFEKRIAFWEEEMRNRPSDEQASNCYREAVHLLAALQSKEK